MPENRFHFGDPKRTFWAASVTNLSPQSHILPHTVSAGDSYYIGDVYEKSRIGQSGELIDEHLLDSKASAP